MSTQIKKNGNWVTVAGGTRMWVGTKAALQAALDAGELVDGTAVMVTDDYEEGKEVRTGTATISASSTSGESHTVAVTFDTPMPNTNYAVTFDAGNINMAHTFISIGQKTVNGFTVSSTNIAGVGQNAFTLSYQAFEL